MGSLSRRGGQRADRRIVVVGERQHGNPTDGGKPRCGEPGSVWSAGGLIQAVFETARPPSCADQRPAAFPRVDVRSRASLVEAWNPESAAAKAVADVLFGITIPAPVGHHRPPHSGNCGLLQLQASQGFQDGGGLRRYASHAPLPLWLWSELHQI